MKSAKHGNAVSPGKAPADRMQEEMVEVVNVSAHGLWLSFGSNQREMFLPFRVFPWFRDATIKELSNIEVERGHIFRWPDLDVDLDLECIEHPERFPLVAQAAAREGASGQPGESVPPARAIAACVSAPLGQPSRRTGRRGS